MQAIQFLDTAENICDISQMLGKDVTVSYADPDEPVLIVSNGEEETVLTIGMFLIKTDDGRIVVLNKELVHQIVLEHFQKCAKK